MSDPDGPAAAAATEADGVTIITQTRVRVEAAEGFARWQDETSNVVATFPGFVKQTVIPPSPPQQTDWVILQRFTTEQAALAWLHSEARRQRVADVEPMRVGLDDVHLVHDAGPGARPVPVSVVIATRIRPGQEPAYGEWEHRIAAAQSRAPGFQGYRFEPPIPGVQDDSLAILTFDTEANLQGWLDSPERHRLLQEAEGLTQDYHTRIVRTGFEQWFPLAGKDSAPPAAWKQNMIVLSVLYPVVFLFGAWVQTPWLMGWLHMPFWLALFIANIVGIALLNTFIPLVSKWLGWWLHPAELPPTRANLIGAGIVAAAYAVSLLVFSQFP